MVTPTLNTPGRTEGPWEICSAKTVEDEFMIVAGEGHDHGLVAVVRTLEDARLTAASPALYAALEAMDSAWLEEFAEGPDGDYSARFVRPQESHLLLWRQVQAALNAANPSRGK